MKNRINLSAPDISQADINTVIQVLKSGQLSLGQQTEKFEQEMARFVGAKYAAATSSGTTALHLAVIASGVKPDDEVITSPFSFVASTNCFLYEKAIPKFVDIDPETFNLDVNKIETAISPKTKAIIGVDIFGYPAEWQTILTLAKKYHLKVIEDAAEALGAKYKGKMLGSLGHPTIFAFYPNKQMTTAEGGMLATNDPKLHQLVKGLLNQGRGPDLNWLKHEYLGYNYRLTEIQAALGRSQLKRVKLLLKKRNRVANWYSQRLKNIPGIHRLKSNDSKHQRSWFVYIIRLDKKLNRDQVMKKLLAVGVPTKAYLPSIHLQPYMKKFGFRKGDFPVAEAISASTLALPFYTEMRLETVELVCQKLTKILKSK